jgi:hypothetical protein
MLDSDGSIDVDLGNNEWTKTSSIKSCGGIRISNHDFVSDCVIVKVTASILTQVVAIDESLTAFANEIVVGQHRDRQ